MATYHIRKAYTPKEKDLYEIMVMVGFLALVLGAITGHFLIGIMGAIGGGIIGCALGVFIVHRVLWHNVDNGAKEVKFREKG